ncbi:MAG: hypothetical protein LUG64_02165 [Clostridiales bacterium]|nr:hypothetical protein [Clostridiales bacterium]
MEDEVGVQIPAGVAVGIKENEDATTSAIDDLVSASTDSGGSILGNIAAAITGSKDSIKDALQTAVSGISVMATASTVSPDTVLTAAGGSTDNSRNVNQNVSINNTFNGDKAIQRKAASAMDNSAEDVTAALARGLAYAR